MIATRTYDDICRELRDHFQASYQSGRSCPRCLTGILFAPATSVAGQQIRSRLQDYHVRSGAYIDFFLAGYGAFWPGIPSGSVFTSETAKFPRNRKRGFGEEEIEEEAEELSARELLQRYSWLMDRESTDYLVVAKTYDRATKQVVEWLYCSELFYGLVDEVKRLAPRWKYSGEADLLLADAVYDEQSGTASVDFTTAVVLDLEALLADGAVASVPRLFEKIFAFAKDAPCDDPAWRLSDKFGWGVGRRWLETVVLDLVPGKVGNLWKEGHHYAARDLTNR